MGYARKDVEKTKENFWNVSRGEKEGKDTVS